MNARSKCTCLHGVAHDVREIDGECIDQTTEDRVRWEELYQQKTFMRVGEGFR